ncbi:hypothetical protein LGK97_00780 [Clostridium sp. CS001]|uniref:hypothetical protein n=1 Tax=Clostridium sp. CS001 TaxID=2880648 RepID=UPI001CF0E3E9|nr:hypothetical protein [Clostridium sp. CS001]MCB2288299.1 hypothetical protein [Clostridium sp. CS001]
MLIIIWFLIGLIASIWALSDASDRGKSGCLVFILVFFGGPIGLVIWLLIRPEK